MVEVQTWDGEGSGRTGGSNVSGNAAKRGEISGRVSKLTNELLDAYLHFCSPQAPAGVLRWYWKGNELELMRSNKLSPLGFLRGLQPCTC